MENCLSLIEPRIHHNYVAFFLTFACNLKCSYCINHHEAGLERSISTGTLTTDEWIQASNRLVLRDNLPLTLQGGEPALYKGFYRIVNEVKKEINMDLLTNMSFDVDEFIRNVPIWRFTRETPYAPIRVSYHPGQNDIDILIGKTIKLQDAGFRIGIYGILHPDKKIENQILRAQKKCLTKGIDFRTKEFLGEWNGKVHGDFKYERAVDNRKLKHCECKTTEIITGPDGNVYRCHSDLYNRRESIAHILDNDFDVEDLNSFKTCKFYGACNPCDVKIKTNRFQIFDHTSVEIRNIWALESKEKEKLEPVTQASSL